MTLYFEAQVTIEPVFDEAREQADLLAQKHGFKLAKLLLKKREIDTAERSSFDTFMTSHGLEKGELLVRMQALIIELKRARFKVWRYKLEDVLIDSRKADTLELI